MTTEDHPTSAGSTRKRKRGPLANSVELVVTVAVAVGLALLIQAVLVKPYKIPSGSMQPTLKVGQRILVNRLSTHPGLGDIVVFHPPVGADEQECGSPSQGSGHAQACDTHLPDESSETFVKRVVGLPGDHLRIINGIVYRNGVKEKLAYASSGLCTANESDQVSNCAAPCTEGASEACTFSKTITVPPGEYYMMGDNRGDSDDSRFWGPVPQKWIIGEAFFTYWPIDRVGFF